MNRKAYSRMTLGLATVLTIALSLPSNAWAASWKEKVLYSFQYGSDGAVPAGSVVFDPQGNLYGATTERGGLNCAPLGDCGIVYELSPPTQPGAPWTETLLYVFKGRAYKDGDAPLGSLVRDTAGNLYGATVYGGTGDCVLLGKLGGCGTVFELSPPARQGDQWTETILYSFKGGKDGYAPQGSLVFDTAGNLYGSTWFGGGYGGSSCDAYFQYCGTIFELSPPKQKGGAWTEKVLYSFKNGTDGGQPNGGLSFDKHGALYGTTYCGGATPCNGTAGSGVVLELRPPAKQGGRWQYGLAFTFNGSDGGVPSGNLVFDAKGNMYGAALSGGKYQEGIAFQLAPPTRQGRQWKEIILHNFGVTDGLGPNSGLIVDKAGNLYGTTYEGGNPSSGVIYRLMRRGNVWDFAVIYNFKNLPDGIYPLGLVFNPVGDLFGASLYGGDSNACRSGCGTVFEAKP
jgi:uncharacterized repeat protein (TIGR03803 family)